MNKKGLFTLAIIFATLTILSSILAMITPIAIVLLIICFPVALTCWILWWCAGTRDGDIPFIGY